jgi:hypothetical protein
MASFQLLQIPPDFFSHFRVYHIIDTFIYTNNIYDEYLLENYLFSTFSTLQTFAVFSSF